MIQAGKRVGVFAVWNAIAVRTHYSSADLRRLAKRSRDGAQARRLLAIAAVLDGASRVDAAKSAGMDCQTTSCRTAAKDHF